MSFSITTNNTYKKALIMRAFNLLYFEYYFPEKTSFEYSPLA